MSANRIAEVVVSTGLGGFFFDDQAAIKAGAERDGYAYLGTAQTPGFAQIREPAQSVSVMLILEDGYVAHGDCASVQYTGVGGREPRFQAEQLAARIREELAPALIGLEVSTFRLAAEHVETVIEQLRLGRATAYGVSQALLDAAAHNAGHHVMARVIQDEWRLDRPLTTVPIYGQTGEDRYHNADKMILKQVPVIPHALINTPALVGSGGDTLVEYISWLVRRVRQLRISEAYLPVIHVDVYGQIGAVADNDPAAVAEILVRLEHAAQPHQLRIEHAMHANDRQSQIAAFASLKQELNRLDSTVQLIADEWANTAADIQAFAESGAVDLVQIKTPDLGSIHHTVDAILDCQARGVGTVLGGSCAETDRSARTTTNIGVATGVTQMLAKPGMGFDEGFMIVTNEMNRAVALGALQSRAQKKAAAV